MDIQWKDSVPAKDNAIHCFTKTITFYRPRPKICLRGKYVNEIPITKLLEYYREMIKRLKKRVSEEEISAVVIVYDKKRGKNKGIHVRYALHNSDRRYGPGSRFYPGYYGWDSVFREEYNYIFLYFEAPLVTSTFPVQYYLDDDGNKYDFPTLKPMKEEIEIHE